MGLLTTTAIIYQMRSLRHQNERAVRHYERCDCGAEMRLAVRDYGTVWFCRKCKRERITQFACLRGVN